MLSSPRSVSSTARPPEDVGDYYGTSHHVGGNIVRPGSCTLVMWGVLDEGHASAE